VLHGDVSSGFEPIADQLATQLASSRGGAAVCVYHRGRCVVDMWGGVKDEQGTPWQRDTMAVSYSTSMGVISTALPCYGSRRARLRRWSPATGRRGGAGHITVRDVLAHKAGLSTSVV
jgi:CubicO group peptidase (beta-lactamase class C family)